MSACKADAQIKRAINAAQQETIRPGIQNFIQQALSLDLSAEQKLKIKAIVEGRLDKTEQLQDKALKAMQNYLDAALENGSTKNQLIKKNKEVQSAYETLRNFQLETWLFVRASLNEDQLSKLKDSQNLAFEQVSMKKAKNTNKGNQEK
jgi:hypothetical protein